MASPFTCISAQIGLVEISCNAIIYYIIMSDNDLLVHLVYLFNSSMLKAGTDPSLFNSLNSRMYILPVAVPR